MPDRVARSKPSPEPSGPSRNDTCDDDLCLLCGDLIPPWPGVWCELFGAEERTTGFAHARCVHEYQLFATQMPFASALLTPGI